MVAQKRFTAEYCQVFPISLFTVHYKIRRITHFVVLTEPRNKQLWFSAVKQNNARAIQGLVSLL